MGIITLMTDFGTKDGNVGVMQGVILRINPGLKIVNLSHYINPQNIREAAIVLHRHTSYFPEDTVHVVVVDPGVGTTRRPIAVQAGTQRFVGPDNGVFTLVYEQAESRGLPLKIFHTNNPEYWLSEISNVFHGRDIFSPVAAHWASGVPVEDLGVPIDDPVRFEWSRPRRAEARLIGEVVQIDHFGNVISNIHKDDLGAIKDAHVTLCDTTIEGLVSTFGERQPGDLVALFSSTNYLFAAEVNGNAAKRLNAKVGDVVEVVAR